MEENLDILKKIKPVDVPPFLFTRVQARIDSFSNAPEQWRWGFAAAVLIVFAMNLGVVLTTAATTKNNSVEDVVSALHLSTSNALYNE